MARYRSLRAPTARWALGPTACRDFRMRTGQARARPSDARPSTRSPPASRARAALTIRQSGAGRWPGCRPGAARRAGWRSARPRRPPGRSRSTPAPRLPSRASRQTVRQPDEASEGEASWKGVPRHGGDGAPGREGPATGSLRRAVHDLGKPRPSLIGCVHRFIACRGLVLACQRRPPPGLRLPPNRQTSCARCQTSGDRHRRDRSISRS